MHEKLMPCPCCGGSAELIKGYAAENIWPHGEFHRVFCGVCQLRQLFHRTPAEAIAAWNHRAPAEAGAPDGWEVKRGRFSEEILVYVPGIGGVWTRGENYDSVSELLLHSLAEKWIAAAPASPKQEPARVIGAPGKPYPPPRYQD